MAATLTKTWQADSYATGPGRGSTIGTSYLRNASIVFDGGTTTLAVVPADLGLVDFDAVFSIVSNTAGVTFAATTFTSTTLTITASGNGTVTIFILGKGQ